MRAMTARQWGLSWILAGALALGGPMTCGVCSAAELQVPRDHQSIQAAIDASQEGDTVLVEPGVYQERVKLRPGVTVRSFGDESKGKLGLKRAEATVIDGQGGLAKQAGVTMAENAVLDGFTIIGVGLYDDAKWKKHHATQGEHQSHEHIGAEGVAGIAIRGVNCTVRNNIVHHIGYTGIAIEGALGHSCTPHIVRNICYRNMGGGIGSMKKSSALIEENICFENFYAGIGHDNASPTVIANTCYGNIRAGIGISEGACPHVRNNKCFANRRAGIGTRTGANTKPIIEDNDCYENDMAGIGADEGAAPVIRKNRCFKNKLAGIGSRNKSTPLIIGNECYQNEKAGIGQESDATTLLVSNYCHHNKTAGIGFAACQSGRATVIDNRVIDNSLVAVGINAGWNVRLVGNELSRQGGLPPIVMVFKGSQATFSGNTIRGSGVAGIRTAGIVRIEGNTIQCPSMRKAGPPNFAVWSLAGAQVKLIGNSIQGWRHGLLASESDVVAIRNRVQDFHNAAFVLQKSSHRIQDNVAFSSQEGAKVIQLSGGGGQLQNNRMLKKPAVLSTPTP